MRDFYLGQIAKAFEAFGLALDVDAYAVAVFDHGNSPPGYSDRRFRFDFLAEAIQAHGRLSAFACERPDAPRMTRMLATARSRSPADHPLLMMDTAPAAVLGALEDPRVGCVCASSVVANVGNFHTLAFHLGWRENQRGLRAPSGRVDARRIGSLSRQAGARRNYQ